jgi:DnaJ-class molecular chaperone
LEIPAGIKNWSFLKYAWRGNEWVWNIPAWDLYVKINVEESNKYSRRQDDLYTNADVSLFDVVLGWEVEVQHPEGKIKVKIPKGTQIGQKIRVWWKWFWEKGLFSKRWDMIIELNINIPKRLTKEQEKLWKELQKAS